MTKVANEFRIFGCQAARLVAGFLITLEEVLDAINVVDNVVVFVDGIAPSIKHFRLVDVASERTELIVVLDGQGSVDVHDPFVDVACHVEQAIVVGGVGVDVHGDIAKVIEGSCDTHVVSSTLDEVGVDGAIPSTAAVSVSNEVTIPRVRLALSHQFSEAVANQTKGCVFPFRFRRQAVVWKKNSVFDSKVTVFAVGTVTGEAFAHTLPCVLTIEVGLSGEVLFINLSFGVVCEQSLTD